MPCAIAFAGALLFAGTWPARPAFHYTAPRGWLNDPNGLSRFRGEWHLFCQNIPDSTMWGRLTQWAHAVSDDLITWKHLPAALKIGEDGYGLWSGSAVTDTDGVAGFGKGTHLLFFTHSKEPFEQRVACSSDGRRYTIHDKPVLTKNLSGKDRDPKVFFHGQSGRWVMLLYSQRNDRHGFRVLNSENLLSWEDVGFITGGPVDRTKSGWRYLRECPDMFELAVKGGNGRRWVVYSGSGDYGVGSFDGRTFIAEETSLPSYTPFPEKMADGSVVESPGYYGGQTFNSAPDGRTLQMAWLWMRAGGETFSQCLSLPQELSLVRTADGLRLSRRPAAEVDSLRTGAAVAPEEFRGRLAEVSVSCRLAADGRIGFSLRGERIVFDRAAGRLVCRLGSLPWKYAADGSVSLRMFVDESVIEIFTGDGLQYFPYSRAEPDRSDETVRVVDRSGVSAEKVLVYPLRRVFAE